MNIEIRAERSNANYTVYAEVYAGDVFCLAEDYDYVVNSHCTNRLLLAVANEVMAVDNTDQLKVTGSITGLKGDNLSMQLDLLVLPSVAIRLYDGEPVHVPTDAKVYVFSKSKLAVSV